MLSDKVSKAFNVICSEFVRDGMKTSTVQYVFYFPNVSKWLISFRCVYDGSCPRWTKTPTPNVGSTIQFFGTVKDITGTGTIRMNIENIVLNVGHQEISAPSAAGPSMPLKKRKFTAFATSPVYVILHTNYYVAHSNDS